ncbi:uncharacterized protein LOC127556813 isoform X1 [Antechinus flavipes]|uniref:uncharacterized protein LOC127556813 isoform X1 n=1 Tax=Antechinus flavipes TaxID=38775 RepID=UPI0022365928|nr:uncharacterized protein LOC127556813 isoform X1 [Antechinus flavipes]
MLRRNRVLPRDLVQEQQQSLFQQAKFLIVQGRTHRIAPLPRGNREQVFDFTGQEDMFPARCPTQEKDIVTPSWVRGLALAVPPMTLGVPLILVEPFPPALPKIHPKSTMACPDQAADAPPNKTSNVRPALGKEYKTSPGIGLEPSSNWTHGEAPGLENPPTSFPVKASGDLKRSTKVHPGLATVSQTSPEMIPGPSTNCPQGEVSGPEKLKTSFPMQAWGSLKRTTKVHLGLTPESNSSPKMDAKHSSQRVPADRSGQARFHFFPKKSPSEGV